jgi:hypothetical protein
MASSRQPIMSLLIQINVKGITVLRSIVYPIAEVAAKLNLFDGLEQLYIQYIYQRDYTYFKSYWFTCI